MMQIYAMFDAAGLPTGFDNDAIHCPRTLPVFATPAATEADPDPQPVQTGTEPNPDCRIPSEAIAITEAQWQDFLEHQGRRRWDGAAVVAYVPPPPSITTADVDRERDRRFGMGATITLADGRSFVADIDDTARINITALAVASSSMGAGATIDFRAHDNATVALSAADIGAMAEQAMARVSAIYAASWALKALDPIPDDYAADSRWPG